MKKLFYVFSLIFGLNLSAQVTPIITNLDFATNAIGFSGSPSTGIVSAMDRVTGHVYMAGFVFVGSQRDLYVVQFDSTGAQVNQATYDFAGFQDRANAICISGGSVFVTGASESSVGNSDIITIAYDANLNVLWTKRYVGTATGNDGGNAITADPAGNVYVGGFATNLGTGRDYTVIKYNAAGTQQFVYSQNGTATNSNDAANAIVWKNHKIYVTGNIQNLVTNSDVYSVRLDTLSSAAVVDWVSTQNGTANGNDSGKDIEVEGSNAIICGSLNNTTTSDDYYYAVLTGSTGIATYTNSYDGGFNGIDVASSLIANKLGNYAITGLVQNSPNYEIHTRCYTAGSFLWNHIQPMNSNFNNSFPHISVDTIFKYFYVAYTCSNTATSSLDALLYQIDPLGVKTWSKTFNGGNGKDVHSDLTLDGLGRIYLSTLAETTTANVFNIKCLRYSQTPVYFPTDTVDVPDKNYIFQKNDGQLHDVNGSRVSESEVGYYYQGKSPSVYINNNRVSYLLIRQKSDTLPADSSVRVDMNFVSSNLFTDIYSYDTVSNYYNYFIDSIGPVVNVRGYNRVFIPNVWSLTDIHHSSNTNGLKSFFCFKMTEAVYTHVINLDGADTTYINGSGELIAETPLGKINIGGVRGIQIDSTLTPFSVTTAWTSLGSNNYRFSITGLHPYLPLIIIVGKTGALSGSAPSNINNLYWSTYIGDVGNENIYQSEIDAKDQLYTVGYTYASNFPTSVGAYQGTGSNPNNRQFAVFSKFDPFGDMKYSTYYGSAGYYNPCGGTVAVEAMDITVDSLYNVYIVGKTNSTTLPIKGPVGSMTYTNAGAGCQNAFIAKFNPTGNDVTWASYFGGTGYEMFWFVKYGYGNIICGGASQSSSIPLVSPAPNSYQVSTGRGCYLRLDTSGQLLHNTKLKGEPKRGDFDNNGNVFIVGSVSNLDPTSPVQTSIAGAYQQGWAGGANDWFIHKFNPSDSLTWATNVGGSGNDLCTSLSIRDTLLGICGYGIGSANFPFLKAAGDSGDVAHFTIPPTSFSSDDIQMAKFDIKTGKRIWVAYHATFMIEQALDLTFDSDYNMYLTGSARCPSGTTVSCTGNQFRTLAAGGYYNQSTHVGQDAFILAFDKSNQRKWLTWFGAGTSTYYSGDIGDAISINSKNQLFSCGQSYLGSSSLPLSRWNSTCWYDSTSADSYPALAADGYITMFDVSNFTAIGIVENSIPVKSNSFILFPNPNSGSFTIKLNENINEPVNIEVYNVLGQNVYSEKKIRDKKEIPLEFNSLKQGVYFVHLSNQNFNETVKFIVQ